MSGSLSVVAGRLGGEVDTSTLSRWIKKLRLRYTEDNLPGCDGCRYTRPVCEFGICRILVELERLRPGHFGKNLAGTEGWRWRMASAQLRVARHALLMLMHALSP